MKQFWKNFLRIITFGLLDLRLARSYKIIEKLEHVIQFIKDEDKDLDGFISVDELWKILKDVFEQEKSSSKGFHVIEQELPEYRKEMELKENETNS